MLLPRSLLSQLYPHEYFSIDLNTSHFSYCVYEMRPGYLKYIKRK